MAAVRDQTCLQSGRGRLVRESLESQENDGESLDAHTHGTVDKFLGKVTSNVAGKECRVLAGRRIPS